MGDDHGNEICFWVGLWLGSLLTVLVWAFIETYEIIPRGDDRSGVEATQP